MKNILAENLLRFGVKNLSDTNQKNLIVTSIMETINQHGLQLEIHKALTESSMLTEAEIDLLTTPGIDKANKYFQTAYKNRVPNPAYVLGQYYLKSDSPVNYADDMSISGPVYGFVLYTYGTTSLPIISNGASGEGGRFTFLTRDNKITSINWDTTKLGMDPRATAKNIADDINIRFNAIPLKDLQTMYNAHPKKANFDQFIATFKASTAPFKALLTGNAKAFFGV